MEISQASTPADVTDSSAAPASAAPEGVEMSVPVAGMTCEHCVAAVRSDLSELDGVTSVDVALVKGGTSTVTVRSERQLNLAAVSEAIDEAGYSIAQ